MSKIKRIVSCLMVIVLVLSASITNASAASVKWSSRYDTFKWNSSHRPSEYVSVTRTFTTEKIKKNKNVYIQMHVGYDSSSESAKEAIEKIGKAFGDPSAYYKTIKEKMRFNVTVKDAKGKIVAQYKNVKYGHVTVFKCNQTQKYTVTVKPYFSSYNSYSKLDRGAAFYSQWSASYYYKWFFVVGNGNYKPLVTKCFWFV